MSKDQFVNICTKSLELKGLSDDPRYKKRLKWELDEVIARQKWDYFLNLFQNKIRYPKNQNNLLICWLLGIVKDFDIDQNPSCEYGEYPDIDVDYLKEVREYLKGTWAPQYFGQEYVCNIGSYTTFGIKNTLQDMARVHDRSRDEVLALTKNIENKDEDGDPITWETALKQYPELAKYCEENKDVAQAVQKLLYRNRGMGVHAAGLIIANSPLHQLVPLYKRKDALQASAWTEGLHGQDLGPVGLVKFDLLVIANLKQIAICCELIKKRHGIEGVCNLPGQPDWSDVPKWRNDPKALEMANRGDLKCIFQFDSEGIRNLVKNGGVDSFEDLVAYTALYRPGPLNCLKKGTKVTILNGTKEIEKLEPGLDEIGFLSKQGKIHYTKKYFVTKTGNKKLLKIKTKSGKILYASEDHLILTEENKYLTAGSLKKGQKIISINHTIL